MRDSHGRKILGDINRREFLISAVGSSVVATPGESAEAAPAQAPPTSTAPADRTPWIEEMPVVVVGNWDDMPMYRRRTGGAWASQEADYLHDHTEETAKKLKDLGVTLAILHFFKGFGLKAEAGHIAEAKELAAYCHQAGIKVGVYVGSTIFYENFLLENPAAEDWLVGDYLGAPVMYGHSTFRKRVYFMHPGYREYIQRVLRVAIEDVHADLIHFDNTSMRAEEAIFQHPLAVEDFRRYLAARLTPDQLESRLGIRDPKYVLPPRPNWAASTIEDPLFQEWTEFRCEMLSQYYGEMSRYIRSLNPAVAIDCNPHRGLSGFNVNWYQGVDYPRLLQHMEAVWSEEGDEAGVTPQGILVSKIRTYKMANKLDTMIFAYTGLPYSRVVPDEGQIKVAMAESMAYNHQCLGFVGGIRGVDSLPASGRKYIQFFHKNFRLFKAVESAADVAVLHSFFSLAYNSDQPYQSTWLFEQSLIQARIPFDVIFDVHLKDLSQYRVLVLADQECLSDEQIDLIRQFVMNGGALVATGATSLYTERREFRPNYGLAEVLKVDPPKFYSLGPIIYIVAESKHGSRGPARNQVGRGRTVYIPEVKAAVEKPSGVPMTHDYWKLPLNSQELVEAVNWAAGGEPILMVNAPFPVTTNLLIHKPSRTYLIHLVDYDTGRVAPIENTEISLRAAGASRAGNILVHAPETDEATPLHPEVHGQAIRFVIPSLKTYAVVEVVCG